MLKTIGALALLLSAQGVAARTEVEAARIAAHIGFLADPALHGRGSLTPDEATAAAYVAAQFRSYGLDRAPGMDGYLQSAPVLRQKLATAPVLLVDGEPVAGATMLTGTGGLFGGEVAVPGRDDAKPKVAVLVANTPAVPPRKLMGMASAREARVLIVPEDAESRRAFEAAGGRPRVRAMFPGDAPSGGLAIVSVPASAMAALTRPGAKATLAVPFELEHAVTTNAVAYLPGTDPTAGVILLSAHLDHLGVGADGRVWPGANDDASGVAALLEIARTLAAGKRPRRGVLFVAYGSEEAGGFGARWFADHAPVPLTRITANIEFEMLGAPVPKLAPDRLQFTGFERSNLGPALRAHGALVDADPYPEQNYFRRSDNYALALRGVVAHTVSGHGAVETYHTPRDTPERIDMAYLMRTVRSLARPIRWLVDGRFEPAWNSGQRPSP